MFTIALSVTFYTEVVHIEFSVMRCPLASLIELNHHFSSKIWTIKAIKWP